jgi:hypothetical protein
MKFVILIALVWPFAGVAQEPQPEAKHAPTVAQCKADQAVWSHELEGGAQGSKTEFMVLRFWPQEMSDCAQVDPSNSDKYLVLSAEAAATMARREFDFLKRHDLFAKFVEEDRQGIF